jgi:hypothetical protein
MTDVQNLRILLAAVFMHARLCSHYQTAMGLTPSEQIAKDAIADADALMRAIEEEQK